jgi:TatD DNase family protein
MFVDSHCHLNFPELRGRLDQILTDMQHAQVAAALCISTTLEECPDVVALAQSQPHFWASVGVHPDTEGLAEPDLDILCALAAQDKVVAIGETGLDYYRLSGRNVADMAWQRDRFRVHIQAARRTGLPLIIHTRASSEDTLRLLREEQGSEAGGVFHCFTETVAVARAALDLGFYISLSGILTFRNADELREVARMVPLDRLLIETDSPYLAPMPFRGKTNSPAWVPYVAAELARQKGLTVEAVAEATTRNFETLFKVGVPPLEVLS